VRLTNLGTSVEHWGAAEWVIDWLVSWSLLAELGGGVSRPLAANAAL
jgi:hypothetical protein